MSKQRNALTNEAIELASREDLEQLIETLKALLPYTEDEPKAPDSFMLVRRSVAYKQTDNHPKIRIQKSTYDKLTYWAVETGLSVSELVKRTVDYAERHIAFVVE